MPYTAEPEALAHVDLDSVGEAANSSFQRWDEEEWATQILDQAYVQETSAKLNRRVQEFLAQADASERDSLEESRSQYRYILFKAKELQLQHRPERAAGAEKTLKDHIRDSCATVTETAYQYTQMLDVMVGQAPEYVALAYGAIKIILVVQINYTELKLKVREYMDQIKGKFEVIDHLTAYIPTAHLVKAISQAYSLFSRFLAKGVKYYTQSRLKSYFKSVAKPWKKFEDIVNSIEQSFISIRDIANYHGLVSTHASLVVGQANLAINSRIVDSQENMSKMIQDLSSQVKAITVAFSKQSDVQETAALLHQRVEEELDQVAFADGDPENESQYDALPDTCSGSNDLDELLNEVFTELRNFNEASANHMRAIKELPEMRTHRSKQKNILRMEKVMTWIEADTSQLLNIDACGFLQRADFNTLFTIPILVLGGANYESVLVLRHFCGDSQSVKTNSYRTLVQALLFQLLQQHPYLYQLNRSQFTRAQASDMEQLWKLLVSFIKEVKASCTFIIIGGIDAMESESSAEKARDKEIIVQQLLTLVKDSTSLVKILLTSSLALKNWMLMEGNSPLAEFRGSRQPQRTPSLSIIDNEMALIPSKLVEIQEKRQRKVYFAEISLLYPPNSTIYSFENGSLRAFVVTQRSGMEPISPNYWSPLVLRSRSVRHNGKQFVRQIYDFTIPSFTGGNEISNLKYIPSGYLKDEFSHRAALIARGREYRILAEGVHYRQMKRDGVASRVIIHQDSLPEPPHLSSELIEDYFVYASSKSLKPLTFMLCPSHITAYPYEDRNETIAANIDELEPIVFNPEALDRMILPAEHKETLRALVSEQQKPDTSKKKGLIILLHGVPGVGKTATVKAIAEVMRAPLRVFHPSNLGKEAADAASHLAYFFETTQKQKAIALIDDADVILEKRTVSDLERNTIVAVFLSSLEQYSGTLFLTTNRVGTFDEAFFSRIRLSVHFQRLNFVSRKWIWENHIKSLGTSEEYHELLGHAFNFAHTDLNGRQIGSVFLNAKQLAKHKQTKLSKDEIELAIKKVIQFQEYMTDATWEERRHTGKSDRLR